MSVEAEDSSGIPILSWFDGPAKHSIESVFHGLNAKVESLDLLGNYHRTHIKALRNEVQHIKLLGMSSPAKLAELYHPARVSTTIKRRLYADEWLDEAKGNSSAFDKVSPISKRQTYVDGDAFVEKNKRVAILGGPGAGKTTFLKFLALAYIEKTVFDKTNLKTSKLPFFIPLPIFSKLDVSVFDFLVTPIKDKTSEHAEAFMQRMLNKGHAIVLLDSLDEVPKHYRPGLIEKIREFCSSFPDACVVISCRTADYDAPLDSFFEVEIAKLNKTAVHKIVAAWFQGEPQKAASLREIIDHDKGIASLTETPLLLSLLCIQFKHDLSLPKRKVELFKRCSEALLRDWDTGRGFRRESSFEELTDQGKEKLFEAVAFHFTVDTFTFAFPYKDVYHIVSDFCAKVGLSPEDAPAILEEVDQHHGIIERFSQDHYGFSHTSFQEYFAARSILSKGRGLKTVQDHFDNEDFYPVIEFIVAMADDPADVIDFLIEKSDLSHLTNYPPMAKRTVWVHLLYRCLATRPYLSPNTRIKAIQHIISSQIEIARIYGAGGVFPMSQLVHDGIHHPFFWTNKRTSLSTALQPFRKLSNEILKTSVPGYADAVFEIIPDLDQRLQTPNNILKDALFLNLVTPLSKTHGPRVDHALRGRLKQMIPGGAVSRIIEGTLKTIGSNGG